MLRGAAVQQARKRRRRRGYGARIFIALAVAFLLTPLYKLQIAASEQYELRARQNRMRPVVVRAPRGTIYDRHGRVVAENTVGYQVLLMPAELDSMRAQVTRLQPLLDIDSAGVEAAFNRYRRAPHLPMEVLRDAPPEVAARVLERQFELPGVVVQEYAKRHYPAGPAIAHFIGFVAEIEERQLNTERFQGYEPGRWVGRAGLELQYEEWLGGQPGVRYLEIDARGRLQGPGYLPDVGIPPVPGKDLQLYLDLDLQEYIAEIFPKEFTGAIVAIEPQTGGVLAYYSNPSFDPNEFVGGVSAKYNEQLQTDPRLPQLDRVVGSGQPAASTWKLAVAGMALDLGILDPEEFMPEACNGGLRWGGRYAACWLATGHGRVNLINGIKNSCNVYFYQVGIRIGLTRMMETGARLGFDTKTGIDVPHEKTPEFPTDLAYWERRFGGGYVPRSNEVMSLSIGQGPITMSAIKLAHIYSALGMPDGRVPAPRLAMDMDAQRDTFQFRLDPRDVWYINAGMRRVLGPGGTAALSRLQNWEFLGKTGTAENGHGPPHAWFVGTGAREPGAEPEIAVTMFLEFAEHGYTASGYVAEAINFYLDRKYNRPFRMWATPRHRLARNLRINWNWNLPVVDPPMPGSGGGQASVGGGTNPAGGPDTTAQAQGQSGQGPGATATTTPDPTGGRGTTGDPGNGAGTGGAGAGGAGGATGGGGGNGGAPSRVRDPVSS